MIDNFKIIAGTALIWAGYITSLVAGLYGFILSFGVVSDAAGFWGVVIGLTLAPVVFAAAPIYALVAWGDATILIVNYGGLILGFLLYFIGSTISGA